MITLRHTDQSCEPSGKVLTPSVEFEVNDIAVFFLHNDDDAFAFVKLILNIRVNDGQIG